MDELNSKFMGGIDLDKLSVLSEFIFILNVPLTFLKNYCRLQGNVLLPQTAIVAGREQKRCSTFE